MDIVPILLTLAFLVIAGLGAGTLVLILIGLVLRMR
jgi:hypothetical protein